MKCYHKSTAALDIATYIPVPMILPTQYNTLSEVTDYKGS